MNSENEWTVYQSKRVIQAEFEEKQDIVMSFTDGNTHATIKFKENETRRVRHIYVKGINQYKEEQCLVVTGPCISQAILDLKKQQIEIEVLSPKLFDSFKWETNVMLLVQEQEYCVDLLIEYDD